MMSSPELVAISKATALEAQRQILGCEACTEEAEIPLCWILDRGNASEEVRP